MRRYLSLRELNTLAAAVASITDEGCRRRLASELATVLERMESEAPDVDKPWFSKARWLEETAEEALWRWAVEND